MKLSFGQKNIGALVKIDEKRVVERNARRMRELAEQQSFRRLERTKNERRLKTRHEKKFRLIQISAEINDTEKKTKKRNVTERQMSGALTRALTLFPTLSTRSARAE